MGTNLKELFDVEISSSTKGVTEVGFGTVMILGSTGFTNSDLIRTYDDIDGVASDFATSTPEYKAAASLLSQNPGVEQMKIGKRSALVAQVQHITIVTAVDAHVYIAQVNGNEYSFTAPSSSSVSGIATGLGVLIAAGETELSVAEASGVITLTANVAGNSFSVVVEDANMSTAVVTANHGIADDIIAIQAVDDDWYVLSLTSRDDNDILNAAAFIETQLKMFSACNDSAGALTTGTTDVLAQLFALKYNRTFFLWSDSQATYPEAGWDATSHFTPGNENWAYQTAAGSVASNLTATQRQNVRNKNGNTYETYAGDDVFLFGVVASGEFIDVIRLRDWTVSQIQERLFGASINAAVTRGKIPYDDEGGAIYHSIILGVLSDGVANDGYVEGTLIVNVPKVAQQSQANRRIRKMAGITFSAELASAVNTGSINGIVTV